ncbi:tRNA (N6-threonylcarbamoyladenosine(37)-N6)-methyltransferase TrmO [Thalassotalea insulae]|uniref:tRNA (N6-threonylcarbamoyladenosine(37)-N6)-methyltransferase TrmO n=1 Tax=Thalassotalea insulae TaxID=2056778 RepID=A0ABQ6GXW0_9GAMM|nr:tRNA (N6-threonylcarbamoyladenosine(37)-N6)-methyltransferase TrmO [Thalassotalea insulae]GLX80182.1 tRNA (N6-threonylcarbamoyladenosine(37)-N6)-methyltransferase TrmO [Thalassotalea insulae]
MTHSATFQLNTLGVVTSPYDEKFAIPRQPGLVSAAKGKITLTGDANNVELVRGLEQFSHIWLLFIFHGTAEQGWKPLVRPPRLGGNKKLGVLATRSTFRPNPIGMSVVKLDEIKVNNKQVELHISGLDLLDNTPIIDIKPYIPYSDALTTANAGFADQAPDNKLDVHFTLAAQSTLQQLNDKIPELKSLITQVLAQDPRPAYKQAKGDNKIYGIRLYQRNIKWRLISASTIEVFEIS